MGGGGPHAELHVAVQPDLPVARQGAGGVHHVAFRTPDADYDAWADRLNEFDIPEQRQGRSLLVPQPVRARAERRALRDRHRRPGFAVDEDPATLGEKVVLPPFLEPHREQMSPT